MDQRVITDNGNADMVGSVDETWRCPICGGSDCDRLIHVHPGNAVSW